MLSLAQPADLADAAELAEALRFPAVRLFADRAAAVRPGFIVEAGNVADAVSISSHWNGTEVAPNHVRKHVQNVHQARAGPALAETRKAFAEPGSGSTLRRRQ